MKLRYTAGQDDNGRRVYGILKKELRLSATLIKRLKTADGILVDGAPAFTDRPVAPGETVEL